MGMFINRDSQGRELPAIGKLEFLIEDGATLIEPPRAWRPHLVCVIENGAFDAAGHAYNEGEMLYILRDRSGRPKQWLEYEYAEVLAGK